MVKFRTWDYLVPVLVLANALIVDHFCVNPYYTWGDRAMFDAQWWCFAAAVEIAVGMVIYSFWRFSKWYVYGRNISPVTVIRRNSAYDVFRVMKSSLPRVERRF